jgi:hypothetical protein
VVLNLHAYFVLSSESCASKVDKKQSVVQAASGVARGKSRVEIVKRVHEDGHDAPRLIVKTLMEAELVRDQADTWRRL